MIPMHHLMTKVPITRNLIYKTMGGLLRYNLETFSYTGITNVDLSKLPMCVRVCFSCLSFYGRIKEHQKRKWKASANTVLFCIPFRAI